MSIHPRLRLQSLRARAVNVPLDPPIETASGTVGTAPLVLIDLYTEEGITGHSYIFCYTPVAVKPVAQLVMNLEGLLKGDQVAPLAMAQKLQQGFRLLGTPGLVGMALAGVDMAAWDALAKARGLPLVQLLGGEARPIPAYCSLLTMDSQKIGREAEEAVAAGFNALKIRLGFPDFKKDLDMVRAVRRAIGDEVRLMADYNQSLSVPEAIKRIGMLDHEGLEWVEEPTLAYDFAGHAQIARSVKTPIQIGENWWGAPDMAKSVAAGASDVVMPDAMKIGGVTGWLRAIALAQAHSLPVSSHLFVEISAHLLAITPTAHYLEYMDVARSILKTPIQLENGHALIPARAGIGLEWDEEVVQELLIL